MLRHLEPLPHGNGGRRLAFESLLADISSRFVNVPAHQVDSEIEKALRLICKALAIDEATIFLRDPDDPQSLVLSYVVRDPAMPPPPKIKFTAEEHFPWTNKKLISNETVYLFDIEKAPPEAATDKASWRKYGIRSTLAIPLSTGGGNPFGIWGIDSTTGRRAWPRPIQKRLKLIADVFANALERANAERQLRESEARLRLAAETTGAGFWTLDIETKLVWATGKLRELFGRKPDEPAPLDTFLETVHPDDRESVQRTLDLMAMGCEESVEYRLVQPNGAVFWVMSRGNRHINPAGKPLLTGITLDITERRAAEEAMRNVSGRLLEAQEQERKRIARELHDDINQRVGLLALKIRQLNSAPNEMSPVERHGLIKQLGNDAQAIATAIQAFSHELHSSGLDYLAVYDSIRGLCCELGRRHGTEVVFTHRHVPKSLSPEIHLALFRIAQESINNALKHSGTKKVEVHLQGRATWLELTIHDAGTGFSVRDAVKSRGLGLISMRERMAALKGLLTVESTPGAGTTVHARVPIENSHSGLAVQTHSSKLKPSFQLEVDKNCNRGNHH